MKIPLSNNRSNNRRRGRGGNRSQGGNQLNRIDSRARGNAPQLLEKYRKMAHDSAVNGDRVQAEYYLQFADHYFRVLADSRAQRDEQRPRRDFEREPGSDYDDFEARDERPDRSDRERPRERDERADFGEGERGREGADSFAAPREDNPLTRDQQRGGQDRNRAPRRSEGESSEEPAGLDPSTLPPAIGKDEADEKPRRTRRPRNRDAGDGDETLEAVG
jgi:hypothetical protein